MGSINITEDSSFLFIVLLVVGFIAYPKLSILGFGGYIGLLVSLAVGVFLGILVTEHYFGENNLY